MTRLFKYIEELGARTTDRISSIGQAVGFVSRMLTQKPSLPGLLSLSYQVYRAGVLSLLIIVVAGFFIGLVLGLEGYRILARFGSEMSLGSMVSLTLVRELGPVVSALLFAGRAGSALTAELGQMKYNEELAVMSMMGVDPVKKIFTPRFLAAVISLPMLALIFSTMGIWGGKIIGVDMLGLYSGYYWGNMQKSVAFSHDVLQGIIKSVIFGILCAWVATYQGYASEPTPEGISSATTKTVVYSSLLVLGMDFILTALMFGGAG